MTLSGAERLVEFESEYELTETWTFAAVAGQVETLGLLDRRYFAHEFLCAHWRPAMMAEVAAAMSKAKCIYVGNATLSDNVMHASVPPALQPLLAELQDPILVETIRDLAAAQSFRRDLYRRLPGFNSRIPCRIESIKHIVVFLLPDRVIRKLPPFNNLALQL